MKKMIACFVIGLLLIPSMVLGYANSDDYKRNIKEGFEEIINSPKPLMDSMREEYNASEFKPFGIIGGFFKGSFYTLKGFTYGVFRVLSFNVGEENFITDMRSNNDKGSK